MGRYKVTWSIDVEDDEIITPQEAVVDCFYKLSDRNNNWIWQVTDLENEEKWEVDCDSSPVEITKL